MTLTAARLREVLHYDPETGEFTWRRRHRGIRSMTAGSTHRRWGYRIIGVDRQLYRAHRLVWLYVHGRWPAGEIDHKNLDRTDNRLANLREASRSENTGNTRVRSDSRTGVKGVFWKASSRKWGARIRRGGSTAYLGVFGSIADASAAYAAAAAAKFGEFARYGALADRAAVRKALGLSPSEPGQTQGGD